MSATDPLRKLLRVLRLTTGAAGVSLRVPGGADPGVAAGLVLHEGSITAPRSGLAAVPTPHSSVADQMPVRLPSLAPPDGDHAFSMRRCSDRGRLLQVDLGRVSTWMQPAPRGAERRRERELFGLVPHLEVALEFEAPGEVERFDAAMGDCSDGQRPEGMAWTIAVSAFLAVRAYESAARIVDATVQLPGRMEFQAWLGQALQRAVEERTPLGLMFVNPDDFASVNHRFGHEAGDAVLLEVAGELSGQLRDDDRVYRYGGAVFAVILVQVLPGELHAAAERLRTALGNRSWHDQAVQLSFSCGAALFSPDESIEASELVRRADRALNVAKLGGGCRALMWDDSDETMRGAGSIDRLSGIFTADASRDYRNMLLLWETISVISAGSSVTEIGQHFVERLRAAFGAGRVALVCNEEDEGQRLLAACGGGGDVIADDERELMARSGASGQIERSRSTAGRFQWSVPLPGASGSIGDLLIDSGEEAFDSEDLMFLDALARQVAMALERAQLARRLRERNDLERRALREEVRELRQGLQHARLVYCSGAMEAVLDVLRQVADSDATVLICGESGTGKEMLARTLHEHSRRREAPFVTVDCGAIAGNLLEAELFGRHKGAYTGADSASVGLIAQAEGGTLFLDEIGEVPLDLQAKLLRFVQEKEITPLGSSHTRRVDVRIVSATNRNLADEVAAGRYRADLYYRLQVITVVAPPLRERREDILPLAHYFLDKFALQYARPVRSLTPAAEERLRSHDWPGNVRELQNCMMRTVLLARADVVDVSDLQLNEGPLGLSTVSGGLAAPAASTDPDRSASASVGSAVPAAANDSAVAPGRDDPWQQLRCGLAEQVRVALRVNARNPAPVGRWLREDLVLAAHAHDGDVVRRAADALGMAETTFRRQLAGCEREQEIGGLRRFDEWDSTARLIRERFNDLVEGGGDVVARARNTLLQVVLEQTGNGNRAQGAALMGVSPPTYRRLVAETAA